MTPGTVISGYLVEAVVAERGDGVIVVTAGRGGARVEIAVLPDNIPAQRRDAEAARALAGEHVARIVDVGRLDDGRVSVATARGDGSDLATVVRRDGAQPPGVAVDLVLQACEALAEAHAAGIVHGHLAMASLVVAGAPGTPGAPPSLRVRGFGVPPLPAAADRSPEQLRGPRAPDPRGDIWSLGVVLYELLEGARPFPADTDDELRVQIATAAPAPFRRAAPEPVQAAVLRCLDKAVERRCQSVAELAFELMPFATAPLVARAAVERCARLLGRAAAPDRECVAKLD